jgi:hypothetical protein
VENHWKPTGNFPSAILAMEKILPFGPPAIVRRGQYTVLTLPLTYKDANFKLSASNLHNAASIW